MAMASGRRMRRAPNSSVPSMSGSFRSMMARSTAWRRTSSRAAAPVPASVDLMAQLLQARGQRLPGGGVVVDD